MKKSALIVFIGIDGSGKTTQAGLLVEDLRKKGVNVSYVWCRWEPFLLRPLIRIWKKKRIGEMEERDSTSYRQLQDKKSSILQNPLLRSLWLSSFFVDYGLQVLFRLRIRLLKEGVVISDRLFYDSMVDQAINLGDEGDRFLEALNSWWMRILFPLPDIIIYIDCPEEIAYKRKKDTPDIRYLYDRRKVYLRLAERYGWVKINGTLPVETINGQIKKIVYKKLAI